MNQLLVFTENYARGGGNRYMIDLVNGLSPDFATITLATNRGGLFDEDVRRLECSYDTRSVDVVTRAGLTRKIKAQNPLARKLILGVLILLEPAFMLFNVVVLMGLLRRARPDLALSCNGGYPAAEATLALVFAARMCRVPVVLSIVSMPSRRRPYVWLYDWAIDHMIWRSVNVVVVNANVIARTLAETRDADSRKVKVVHNGVEDAPVAPADTDPASIVLGCVARLDRMKGVVELLRAFASLAGRYPSLRLVFAGQGDIDDEMARLTKQLDLEDRVEYLGHYSGDISSLLAKFHVFVFPSLWEGFPYSIVEAMRSGKPIVSTNVGGIPEAIEAGHEGLLVEPASVDALAAAIERLIVDPGLRHSLGVAARRRFEQDLTLRSMHERIRALLSAGPLDMGA